MTSDRVRAGVVAGVVAASATIGAVLAFSWRTGSPLGPYVASGRAVLGGGGAGTAALLGLGLHVAVAIGWGLLLAAVAFRARPVLLAASAAAVSLLALAVHSAALPAFRLGFGLGVFPLVGPPLYFLYALFAVALALGMRIAR